MLDPEQVRHDLSQHTCRHLEPGVLKPSAVMLLFYPKDGADTILFTRRTEHLAHHAGEIAFQAGVPIQTMSTYVPRPCAKLKRKWVSVRKTSRYWVAWMTSFPFTASTSYPLSEPFPSTIPLPSTIMK